MKPSVFYLTFLSLFITACGNSNNETKQSEQQSPSEIEVKAPQGDFVAPTTITTATTDVAPVQSLAKYNIPILPESIVSSGCEVIVNAANGWLAAGGALSGAIYAAAGQQKMYEEIRKVKGLGADPVFGSGPVLLKDGEVFVSSGHDLVDNQGTRFILQALGPDFRVAPYKGNLDAGYEKLAETYRNVYAEMQKLNAANGVKTIGVIPISSGVFAGAADKDKLYEVLVKESLIAVRKYPNIVPKIYVFGGGAAQRSIEAQLQKAVQAMLVESGGLGGSVALSARASKGGDSHTVPGLVVEFNNLKIQGYVLQEKSSLRSEFVVGKEHRGVFFGISSEQALRDNQVTAAVLKAVVDRKLSSKVVMSVGLGYAYDNLNAHVADNMKAFLSQFNLREEAFKRSSVLADAMLCGDVLSSELGVIQLNAGIRTLGVQDTQYMPFFALKLNALSFASSVYCAYNEVGFNFVLNN